MQGISERRGASERGILAAASAVALFVASLAPPTDQRETHRTSARCCAAPGKACKKYERREAARCLLVCCSASFLLMAALVRHTNMVSLLDNLQVHFLRITFRLLKSDSTIRAICYVSTYFSPYPARAHRGTIPYHYRRGGPIFGSIWYGQSSPSVDTSGLNAHATAVLEMHTMHTAASITVGRQSLVRTRAL